MELIVMAIVGWILGIWMSAGLEKSHAESGKAFTVAGKIYRMVEVKTEATKED